MVPDDNPSFPTALFGAEEVRKIDRFAINILGIPGIELMERAGSAAFEAICQAKPNARTLSAVCGGGNNGGDGYIVARLAHQQGWDVRVYPIVSPSLLKGDALTAYEAFKIAGGETLNFIPHDFEGTEVLVDALLGTGLDRYVADLAFDTIQAINRYRQHCSPQQSRKRTVISIDLPSGLNATTGAVMGIAVKSDLTVCFMGLKQGLFTGDGPEYAGQIIFSSLGLQGKASHEVTPTAQLFTTPSTLLPKRSRSGHKGTYGHGLIVGGDLGFSGAVRLSGEAAGRAGSGLISIATRSQHAATLNLQRPELMCHGVDCPGDLEPLLRQADVLALGPGLGQGLWGQMIFDTLVDHPLTRVMDADALNLLAKKPLRRDTWVLTPHPGEAARLLGVTTETIQSDRLKAASKLQQKYGGVIVLKGSGTLIVGQQGIPLISTTGNPGMGTGGMGDVLTGIILALIAQGLPQLEAAAKAVWLHGIAGDLAATQGEIGLLPLDLMPWIRQLVNNPHPTEA
jgi:NAD(P)H-hydrate epimerase